MPLSSAAQTEGNESYPGQIQNRARKEAARVKSLFGSEASATRSQSEHDNSLMEKCDKTTASCPNVTVFLDSIGLGESSETHV